MLRKLLVTLALLIVVVLAALWLLPTLVDSKKLLEPILAGIEEQSGVAIRVAGDARLGLMPRPAIALDDIFVQLPEDDSPGIRAAEFRLGMRLLPLLSGQVEVDRFVLEKVRFSSDEESGKSPPELDISGQFSFSESTRQLTLNQVTAELRGVTPEPAEFTLAGTLNVEELSAQLDVELQHDDVRGTGTVHYSAAQSPQVDAKFHLNKFSPALYALAGPGAAGEAGAEQAQEDSEPTALPLDALRAMDTRADLSIDEVIWQGHKITNFKARLRVLNGNAILPGASGDIHGGKLQMQANLNSKPAVPRVNTEGSLTGVDIAALLSAAEIEPVMSGRATLDWKLGGAGNNTDAIRDSLQGPIHFNATDAVLTAVGIEQKLCEVVAAVNREELTAELPAESAFEQLSATLLLKNGIARLQPLTARLAQTGLTGTGKLELASQDFEALFSARLSPEIANLDPACRVNERLTALEWPVQCSGNLSGEPKDWCSVDSEEILKDLGENELRRKLQDEVEERYGEDAGAALKKLLGK